MALSKIQLLLLGCVIIGVAIAGYFMMRPTDSLQGQADADNLEQVAMGQKIYAENCASCHGVKLEGQKNWRRQLPGGGLPAPPHDQSGHTWHHPDKLLFNYTKQGGQALAPKGFKSNMPGYGETLSDGQIWAVLAFIKSKWPDKIRRRQARLSEQSQRK
ncbi:MAG: c-type cytochrome [Rhodospirillaceae bacterium]|jgi:mono/diheme cytochrome c family protein|nr:c-type cytochrome [Rhodospirillaceae bacterium]MBT4589710.1 c-type cytochrome [Rhodospirillaceae bacterium]MBT4940664.1 c-type cytochrome [Rhodospirillaceae bacterium]MBT7267067.1 c-type cytochrome [Rhodospirillaceae bacterium]